MAKMALLSLCLIGSSLLVTQAMLVRQWGTDSFAKRLAWSTNLLIEDSAELLSIGMPDGMVLSPGFTRNFSLFVVETDVNHQGSFKALNSWFDAFYVNHTMLRQEHGKLRRFILNRAERLIHEKDSSKTTGHQHSSEGHQHELVICDECVSLEASHFQYGYTTYLGGLDLESSGVATYEGPIRYVLNFQISLVVQRNKLTKQNECISKLEDFKLRKEEGPLRMEGLQGDARFAFLADYLDEWTAEHLNTTVANYFQSAVHSAIETTMRHREMCKDFLTTGVFTHID